MTELVSSDNNFPPHKTEFSRARYQIAKILDTSGNGAKVEAEMKVSWSDPEKSEPRPGARYQMTPLLDFENSWRRFMDANEGLFYGVVLCRGLFAFRPSGADGTAPNTRVSLISYRPA
ncbi:uncharacterized protein GLRG_03708 [Colletotrichum graminicola M1.001]|uniref:Uncharacterized protein n=1 Tax=Colletotrichum graminicola (strain M1.001 / M2 / FGSC 10212) TaxID=645133 RepID=E3QCH6_COLGM|nr:uncharacterized protein GLRG_03708 [Colletotrichum graminicola M1.001]EFQ28564.1 hypothetical protein GLRG_03708 [Colletotrichum graminicola M1.001]